MMQIRQFLARPGSWWKAGLFLMVAVLLAAWWLLTPPGWLGKAVAIGYAVCHRITTHSYTYHGQALPLCARCTGMYLGAFVGLAFQAGRGRRLGGFPRPGILVLFGVFALAFMADGINSFLSLASFMGLEPVYPSQNWLRLATGAGMGLSMAGLLYPAFAQVAWRDWENRPALADWRDLAGLSGSAALVGLAWLSGIPAVQVLLSLLAAATVLLVLTMVYTVASLLVFRGYNRYNRLKQMLLPLSAGFGIALAQIAGSDLLRYMVTGVWDGFLFK